MGLTEVGPPTLPSGIRRQKPRSMKTVSIFFYALPCALLVMTFFSGVRLRAAMPGPASCCSQQTPMLPNNCGRSPRRLSSKETFHSRNYLIRGRRGGTLGKIRGLASDGEQQLQRTSPVRTRIGKNKISLPKNFTADEIEMYDYRVLAFYVIARVSDIDVEVESNRAYLSERGIVGRVYVSADGINSQVSGSAKDIEDYMEWISTRHQDTRIIFKLDPSPELAFPRLRCKEKRLVPLVGGWEKEDMDLIGGRGEDIAPEQWKEMLDKRKETGAVVLDVRNNYEWDLGHFEGASRPKYREFKEFDPVEAYDLDKLPNKTDTPIMMYCTGGIRCEIYSAMLKKRGFDKVYKLQGGIQHYGNVVGDDNWRGKLFVFDRRNAVPLGENSEVVGRCLHCSKKTEIFRNCCNVDCNRLHLCCEACWEARQGCCTEACKTSARVRPHKVVVGAETKEQFDKWHLYRDGDIQTSEENELVARSRPRISMSLMQGPPPGAPDINRPAGVEKLLKLARGGGEENALRKGQEVSIRMPNGEIERAIVELPKPSGKRFIGTVKVRYVSDNSTFHVEKNQILELGGNTNDERADDAKAITYAKGSSNNRSPVSVDVL